MNQKVAFLAIDRYGDDILDKLSSYRSIRGLFLVDAQLPGSKVPTKVSTDGATLAGLLDGYRLLVIVAQCCSPRLVSLLGGHIKGLGILTHLFLDCDSGVSTDGDIIHYQLCGMVNAVTVDARFEAIAAYVVSVNNKMQCNIELNVNFADLNSILCHSKVAKVASGIAFGESRAIDAIRSAFSLFSLSGASDYLINIYTSDRLPATIMEVHIIAGYVQKHNPKSNLLWQVHSHEIFRDDLMVNILAVGFDPVPLPKPKRAVQPDAQPGKQSLSFWQKVKLIFKGE